MRFMDENAVIQRAKYEAPRVLRMAPSIPGLAYYQYCYNGNDAAEACTYGTSFL